MSWVNSVLRQFLPYDPRTAITLNEAPISKGELAFQRMGFNFWYKKIWKRYTIIPLLPSFIPITYIPSLLPAIIYRDIEVGDEGRERRGKEGCSGSYRLAVGFLLIKDESISERPG